MIYYCIVPKNISSTTISHLDFQGLDKIECSVVIRNLSGDILSDKNFLHDYPLCLEIKNKYLNKDTYIELKFYDENKIIEKQGTIDVLYKTRICSFGIGTGCITRNANSIQKKEIKSTIIKNCCYVSSYNSTEIFIINANPLCSPQTSREGFMDFKILNEIGDCIYNKKQILKSYEMIKIDIKKILEVNKAFKNKPLSLTFTSINNFNVFPITFMTNKSIPTGCEHSQPMYGYFRLPIDGPQNRTVNIFKLLKNFF